MVTGRSLRCGSISGSWSRSSRALTQLPPVGLLDADVEVLGRLRDVLPRLVALLVGHILHLVEPGQGVDDVIGVRERFLTFLLECEDIVREVGTGRELAMDGLLWCLPHFSLVPSEPALNPRCPRRCYEVAS